MTKKEKVVFGLVVAIIVIIGQIVINLGLSLFSQQGV
jgi:uncharacterized membrane protein